MGRDLASKKGNSTEPCDRLGTIVSTSEKVRKQLWEGNCSTFCIVLLEHPLPTEQPFLMASRVELEMCLFLNTGVLLWH